VAVITATRHAVFSGSADPAGKRSPERRRTLRPCRRR